MSAVGTTLMWSADRLARALNQPPPTPEQRAVIEAPLTAGLVLAGAGSGKTETMAGRVVFLIANCLVAPDDVLGLTFTRKAAGELAERIRHRLARLAGIEGLSADLVAALEIGQPRVATYNSYAAGIVVEHGPRIGAEPSAEVIGQAMSWGHAASLVEDYAGDMTDVLLAPSTVTMDVLALSAAMAEHDVDPDQLRDCTTGLRSRIEALPRLRAAKGADQVYAEVRKMLNRQDVRLRLLPLVEAYHARKRSAGVIDYSDQVSLAARIAASSPVVGALERQRYGAVLLDEFQDTSYGQLQLMSKLFGEGHPVTAVGDPSQAIYGWRGASTGNMREFARRFGTGARSRDAQADVFPLSVSWRNGAGILTIANDIAKVCADEQLPVVTLSPAPSRTHPGEIRCALLNTQIEEVEWLADELALRWSARASGESFAVLSRARSLLRPVAAALRERDVPVEVLGLGGLIDEPEVSDVVATLRVISDPSSGDAIGRLLIGPRWRIGPRDLMALGGRARWLTRQQLAAPDSAAPPPGLDPAAEPFLAGSEETGSLIEALDDPGPPAAYSAEGYRRLVALREELSWLRRRSGVSLADLIDEVVATLGLGIEVAVRPAVTHARAHAHLQALHEVAEEFTRIAEVPSLSAFLSYLAAAEEEERGLEPGEVETSEAAVSLLTVHAAKGLEWDVVAVPGLTKDVFPQNVTARTEHWLTDPGHLPVALCGDRDYLPDLDLTGVTDQKAAETAYLEAKKAYQEAASIEEWRLAYVAVTRARTTLLCSGSWWTGDAKKPRGASAVLDLVRNHTVAAVANGSRVSVWTPAPDDDATNPMAEDFTELAWPVDPLPPARRIAREAAADLVRNPPDDPMTLDSLAWDAEVDLLLAERDRRRATTIDVAVPAQLSVSELVALRRDPAQLARWIRRPLPSAPAPLARRGTAFHAWLEQRFGATRLVDLDELPGSADEGAAPDEDLEELKAAFLASEWANREPIEVEVPFHVQVGDGLALRGRMDAVFGDVAGGFEVVDWKTGAVPTGVEKQATAIQLAAYRLAWAALTGVDVEQVKAAFVYVRHNETVRPADLATAGELLALVRELPVV
ncbi:MAG: ATP-dependent helicase [Actinomycetota bacterium]|nr:ATP-dependent helicase [Actinomycetota bacterium]